MSFNKNNILSFGVYNTIIILQCLILTRHISDDFLFCEFMETLKMRLTLNTIKLLSSKIYAQFVTLC